MEDVQGVKNEIRRFFQQKFQESNIRRPRMEGLAFAQLSRVDADTLEMPFTVEEILDVVKEFDGNKCSGPDGFNFNFIRRCWNIISVDVCNFVAEFFDRANLPKAVSASLISLIPKVENPQLLTEYRPISLVGSLYKIIAKLLANRLTKVIDKLVSKSQTSFIPGRQIQDGILVLNEVLDYAKQKRKKCFVLKVGFEKAYDKVWFWESVDYMDSSVCLFCHCVCFSERESYSRFQDGERIETRGSVITLIVYVGYGRIGLVSKPVSAEESFVRF